MIALQVQDIKSFMSKLLIGTDFDAFWLSEATVTTSITYTLDGLLHLDFSIHRKQNCCRQKVVNTHFGKTSSPFVFPS